MKLQTALISGAFVTAVAAAEKKTSSNLRRLKVNLILTLFMLSSAVPSWPADSDHGIYLIV